MNRQNLKSGRVEGFVMAKQHYFFKLVPPRPTFTQDMTDDERRLMDEHGRYFQEHFAAGRVLLFGPGWREMVLSDSAFWKLMAKRRLGSLAQATHR
jgi:hypothetical protein